MVVYFVIVLSTLGETSPTPLPGKDHELFSTVSQVCVFASKYSFHIRSTTIPNHSLSETVVTRSRGNEASLTDLGRSY